MNINFTTTEYETLINCIRIANFVADIGTEDDEPFGMAADIKALEQKIFRNAKKFSCDEMVEYDSSSKQYFSTEEGTLDDYVDELLTRHKEVCFWAELELRLALRDLMRNQDKLTMQLQGDALLDRLGDLPFKYREEFHNYGVDRLEITPHGKFTIVK